MSTRTIKIKRSTKETDIELELNMDGDEISVSTGLPFFDHMLNAMAFHGKFGLKIQAKGDLEVDPHHLVEDTGIVLGQALAGIVSRFGPIERFGNSVIPMDEALSEAVVDVSGRSYSVINTSYPQEYSGNFHMPLLREFFTAMAVSGGITMHLSCRYGSSSHHMAESLFKALGRALGTAYRKQDRGKTLSTKGVL